MRNNETALVHIVDDDGGMRKSMMMLFESASLAARGYESAEAFLSEMESGPELNQPGCIVLDLRMRGMSGIDLLQCLRAQMTDIPVILISGHADVPDAVRGMKLGAVDLLQKPIEPAVLLETVRRSLGRSVSLRKERDTARLARKRFEQLTPREMELLSLVVEGRSNKQIAAELGIALKTVANHRASLMAKSGASNGPDLTRLFVSYKSAIRRAL